MISFAAPVTAWSMWREKGLYSLISLMPSSTSTIWRSWSVGWVCSCSLKNSGQREESSWYTWSMLVWPSLPRFSRPN